MDRKPVLWIVALVVVALFAGWQFASAQAEKDKALQRWEYKVIGGGKDPVPEGNLLKHLADLGDAGWELVAVEPATRFATGADGNFRQTTERVFHFKRSK